MFQIIFKFFETTQRTLKKIKKNNYNLLFKEETYMKKHVTLHGKNGEVGLCIRITNPITTFKKDLKTLKEIIRIFI